MLSEPDSGEEVSDEEEEDEELPDVDHLAGGAAPDRGHKRKKDGGKDGSVPLHEMKDFVSTLMTSNFAGMKEIMMKSAEITRSQRQEELAELKLAKKRKTEDEMLETEPVMVKFDGTPLRDNCRDIINSDLRVQLSGPYGDPSTWWRGKMNDDKPGAVIGDAVDYTHVLGADHVNRRTIRISQSRFRFQDLKVSPRLQVVFKLFGFLSITN